MDSIYLKPGREKSLLRRHPWVYSGAVAEIRGEPGQGETIKVYAASGEFLAWGSYSLHSQIRVRVWSWDPEENIGTEFFRDRLTRAMSARQAWIDPAETDAMRLVHGESDGLPGLVVDQYADTLVMQCLSSGTERWRETLADLLMELTGVKRIFERSDATVRKLEGLPFRTGVLRGTEPPDLVQIYEHDLRYWVDVRTGHKTGFYLDQRENRSRVAALAKGCDVLDCFSYTGGFTMASLGGGAQSVFSVETSAKVLSLADKNLVLNNFPQEKVDWREGDVFKVLRELRDRGSSFDMILLDPPKFAPTASQADRAARGYKDINLLAFKLLRPGGKLVTFSCSGGVKAELFQKIVAGAALDAGVEAQIVEYLRQGPDHPVALNFPEGAYLKGFVIRVLATYHFNVNDA